MVQGTRSRVSGVAVNRRFTESLTNPYEGIEFTKRTSKITNPDGSVVFEMDSVEVPSTWSQLATDIIVSKYFRKGGVPQNTNGNGATGSEHSARQVVDRVVGAISHWGQGHGYFANPEARGAFSDELTYMLIRQMAAFNSPVWFNCGLKEAYGIGGDPAGNWSVQDDGAATQTVDGYSRPQVSACFIRTIGDDLMDIAEGLKTEMRMFKYGSGTGSNFSNIRGKGEKLSSGGRSSGLMSFLDVYDRAAGAIKSGGTTRRAAKMVVVDMDHPDIEEFIEWKVGEEDKARALMAAGYTPGMNGEALRTVSGQNANNSVRVTDAFMRAVEKDGKWETRYRTSGETAKSYDARALMRKISEAAWKCADPGMQYHDACNRWNTVPATDEIRATNPCSEFNFVDDSACNLASINLLQFVAPSGEFDLVGFEHACRVLILAQEILCDYASYPTKEIAERSARLRPLGLGYANLGAMLMQLGLPYDSEKGRAVAASLTAIMGGVAFQQSATIAKSHGSFADFAFNREPMLRVVKMHREEVDKHCAAAPPEFARAAEAAWDRAHAQGKETGFRNAQVTLLAPTGTIGLLMDCDTTGIEPDFSLIKYKKLAGGGQFRIVNQSVRPALKRLGYSSSSIDAVIAHIDEHETIEGAPEIKDEHLPIFDCAVKCGATGSRSIDPMGHVRMMAATQPFLCGSISKTVNMPKEATVEDVENVYMESWRLGLKSIALYRDGSKASQVLYSSDSDDEEGTDDAPIQVKRRRLPPRRAGGFTQEAWVGGQKMFMRTGEYGDGKLGEVFVDVAKQGAALSGLMNAFAKAISLGLQHGVPLAEFVDAFTFTRFEPAGPVRGHDRVKNSTSMIDFIFRVLAVEYLERDDLAHVTPEGDLKPVIKEKKVRSAAEGPLCSKCGYVTHRSGTCYACSNCGSTTGCA